MPIGGISTNRKWSDIMVDLLKEFKLWGIAREDIQLPIYTESTRGVKIEFAFRGAWRPIECSKFARDANGRERNLLALVGAVKSTRLADQRGIGQVLADIASLLALPDPTDPYTVLGLKPDVSWTKEEITRAYREAIKETHPDVPGGTQEAFKRVHDAGKALGVA